MKQILHLSLILSFSLSLNGATVYFEDFSDLANGTTTDAGSSAWNIDISGATFVDASDFFEVTGEAMRARDVNGEVIWNSASIDISALTSVTAKVDLIKDNGTMEGSDYIRAYYILDGGAEVLLTDGDQTGDFDGSVTASVTGLSGSTFQIVVRIACNANNERYEIDNVIIAEPTTLFSIKSSTWDDPTAWSTSSEGGACTCIPEHLDIINLESPDVIDIDADAYVTSIDVANGATLRWASNSITLNILNSGNIVVDNGGAIDENSRNNAVINFVSGSSHSITSNDATTGITIDDLTVLDNSDVTFSGSGIIFITDDMLISGEDQTITNNLSGTFTVSDRLTINGDNVDLIHNSGTFNINDDLYLNRNFNTVTNNSTLNVVDQIRFNRDDGLVVNNGTLTGGRLRVESIGDDRNKFENSPGASATFTGELDLDNTTDFTFENGGTMSIGAFQDIDPSASINFTNLANGSLTLTGAAYDTDVRLFASANNNTIIYSRAGDQDILDPQDSYYNLTISNGGTKTIQGSFNVDNTLDMTNGNIDANGGSITLGTSAISTGVLSYTSGSIANGLFERWIAASTIPNGNIAGLFPMGSTSLDRPLNISAPSSAPTTGGTISASANIGAGFKDVSITDGASTVDRIDNSTWSITTGNGLAGGTFNVEMGGEGFVQVGAVSDLRVVLDGSTVGTAGSNSGTTAIPVVQRTGLSLANLNGSFHVGTTDVANSPLPVELAIFNVIRENKNALVTWKTESEINSDYFLIESSLDGTSFEYAAKVSAAGNSNTSKEYEFMLENIGSQEMFFRLKIVDFDGSFEYSPIRSIDAINGDIQHVQIYPNPSSGNLFIQNLPSSYSGETKVLITNTIGQAILKQKLNPNVKSININGANALNNGIYNVNIQSDGNTIKTFKWIKQ